jgi:hypothetical protein
MWAAVAMKAAATSLSAAAASSNCPHRRHTLKARQR